MVNNIHNINFIGYVHHYNRTMQLNLCLVLLLITCWSLRKTWAQNWQSCQTPKRTSGQCVPSSICEYVVQVQTNYGSNIPAVWQNFLASSRCFGTDPRQNFICCDVKQVRTSTQTGSTGSQSFTTNPPYTSASSTMSSTSLAQDEATIFTGHQGNFEASLNRNAMSILRRFTCGVTNTNRISFGNTTKLGEFPWVALLRYDNPNKPFQCGGSLISQRYVVTAAHCVTNTLNKLIGVRLGEYNIDQEEDCVQRRRKFICYKAEDFSIETIHVHPNYNRYRHINDIGLIRMDRDVVFKDHIVPICLPLTNQAAKVTQYPDKYIIAGFGSTESDDTSSVMLKAELQPQTRSHCQNIFRRIRIENVHICAGGENRVDSCKGDSGGPLFASTLYELTARYVLYGVVSGGVAKCGDENSYPGVYTNVVEFMPWITNNIHE